MGTQSEVTMNHGGRRAHGARLMLGCWLVLGAAACGGRSFDDSGEPAGSSGPDGDGQSVRQSCEEACEEAATCARAPYECSFFCGEAQAAAEAAGCSKAYTALVQCIRSADDPCLGRGTCVTAVNAFSVCIFDYCSGRRRDPICGG